VQAYETLKGIALLGPKRGASRAEKWLFHGHLLPGGDGPLRRRRETDNCVLLAAATVPASCRWPPPAVHTPTRPARGLAVRHFIPSTWTSFPDDLEVRLAAQPGPPWTLGGSIPDKV